MGGRQLASKWVKTEALLSNGNVAHYIPTTCIYHPSKLQRMLTTYGFVVIKPVVGSGGNGVIKVEQHGEKYAYTYRARTYSFSKFDQLVQSLSTLKKKRAYMIQQGIQLATISGRPIDYRVKVIKSGGTWCFKSIVGRLARKGLFVTNLCQGGKLLKSAQAITLSFSKERVRIKKEEMRQLTRICIEVLEQKFPGITQLGFDYGIDRSDKIWILEVNTRPQ